MVRHIRGWRNLACYLKSISNRRPCLSTDAGIHIVTDFRHHSLLHQSLDCRASAVHIVIIFTSSTVNTGVFNSSKYKFKINTSMFYKSTWVICKLICHFYKPNIIPVFSKVKFNFISKWFVQFFICRIFKLFIFRTLVVFFPRQLITYST